MASKFELDLKRFANRTVPDNHGRMVAKIGMELARRLILKTPVDTGRARMNWQATILHPAQTVLTDVDPSGQSAISAAAASFGRQTRFNVLWLTNNLHYIERLNAGSSKQAPAHFVEMTIAEIESIFK